MQPITFVLRIGAIIFLAEGLIMLGLSLMTPIGSWMGEAVIVASTLTLLTSPMAYYWVIKPYFDAQYQAENSVTS